MITIHLDNLEFFAHHGLHDEEAITGTDFTVSVSLSFDPAGKIHSIHQTINYTDVYNIIEKHMLHPVALLEMLAEQMAEDILELNDRIRDISIRINKVQPPIRSFRGKVGITFHKAI